MKFTTERQKSTTDAFSMVKEEVATIETSQRTAVETDSTTDITDATAFATFKITRNKFNCQKRVCDCRIDTFCGEKRK